VERWLRQTGILLVLGCAVWSLGAASWAEENNTFDTKEACRQATKLDCYQDENGKWHGVPIYGEETVIEGGGGGKFDEVWAAHFDRSMRANESGTPEHPVVAVDMEQVQFPDVQPYLDPSTNRVRVPIRFVSEKMGAKVEWEQATKRVTILRENLTIQLQVGNSNAMVNSREVEIDAPPVLVDPGRVMVPLRFISEAFGAKVDWVGSEPPVELPSWSGRYQVWIWVPWGFWGTADLHQRLTSFFYRRD
jgi:hypothetical protein